jgi:hypothetical protein
MARQAGAARVLLPAAAGLAGPVPISVTLSSLAASRTVGYTAKFRETAGHKVDSRVTSTRFREFQRGKGRQR